MESNYQTVNQNIFTTATNLVDNKNYKELERTDSYSKCDHLIIDHLKKQFFFTTMSTENHLQKLIKTIN